MNVLQTDDLVGLTASIWEAVLGRAVVPLPPDVVDASTPSPSVTANVSIMGGWEGTVSIVLSTAGAQRAAADMFAMDLADLDEELVDDAVGELANIAAGNIKGMIAEATKLGLPTVVRGSDYRVSVPGANVVCEVAFDCDGEPLKVLVQSPTDLPVVV